MSTSVGDLDAHLVKAFDGMVEWAEHSRLLGEIAMQPNGRHEKTIEDELCRLLREQILDTAVLEQQRSQSGYRRDIVAIQNSTLLFAVEIKTPFTNHDGITNKTRKPEHLPKDLSSLRTALEDGAMSAYYLITPIGCYPVNSSGSMLVLEPSSVTANEKAVKQKFGIRWPTRRDYESTGITEVERAMKYCAEERSLEIERIMGWIKADLPNPQSSVRAFLDLALFRVQMSS